MRKCLAITGIMSAGKSTFSSKLSQQWQDNSHNSAPLDIIEVDTLRRDTVISDNVQYSDLREHIVREFGVIYTGNCYQLDRYSLSQKVFASKDSVNAYNELTAPFFKQIIEQKILASENDVAIVWSHVLENSYQDIFIQNNLKGLIVFLTVNEQEHQKRILAQSNKNDGLPMELIIQRLNVCSSQKEKLELLGEIHYPNLIFDSEKDNDFNNNIQTIISCFPCNRHGLSNWY